MFNVDQFVGVLCYSSKPLQMFDFDAKLPLDRCYIQQLAFDVCVHVHSSPAFEYNRTCAFKHKFMLIENHLNVNEALT
ncbi:ORF25 [Alphabaculovirus altermyunipunctae]|uniref:ORF25 n=1 Tax=Mythimna unipuncta nucleopolyhedrovirus TaxID=447897 RepID=A0A346TPG2_9ABAC|nr:ORF25 [Mythimna unipuncta nucleopolyhedrovirus]AXU41472.1 ORF25 [Mythimna unipuncta nucleopolyhedrovirus]